MRPFLFIAGAAVVLASGCGLQRDHVSTGWEFRVIRPPIVRTESQMLVGANGSFNTTAQTLGQVAGPVLDSDVRSFQHNAPYIPPPAYAAPAATYAAPAPASSIPPPGVMLSRSTLPPPTPCSPPAPAVMYGVEPVDVRRLTCEEWCELMRQIERQKLPRVKP